MQTYHKIQSLYYRDPETNYKTFIDGKFSVPPFEMLQGILWDFTEKVDGTNIRIGWDNFTRIVTFGGRTDRAQLPGQLRIHLEEHFTPERCADALSGPATLIGEGFGGKIQKGSGYRPDQAFILFDVFIEPYPDAPMGLFLDRDAVQSIAKSLNIPVVPILHRGPLLDGVDLVKDGLHSLVSEFSEYEAEGVVARPHVELRDYMGRRVITKIKVKDYAHETTPV